MSIAENKELVQRFIEQVMNEHDTAAIPEFMVEGSFLAGAFGGFVTQTTASFPDFHVTIDTLLGEGDKVMVQATIRATQTGSFMGRAPTGKTYNTLGIYVFTIASGKIVSGLWVFDRMDIAQQLGWLPTPGQD